MAAGTVTFYNQAKHYIGDGTIDLSGNLFRLSLFTSASNANTATLSTYSEVTNEVTEATGYSSSGKSLASISWGAGTSAGQQKWTHANVVWTGTGGTIANVKWAVWWKSGPSATARKLLARVSLSSAQFTVGIGNTLTVSAPSAGFFTLA